MTKEPKHAIGPRHWILPSEDGARHAAAAVPDQLADEVALVGPPKRIRDRLQAWRESGVTTVVCGTRQLDALRILAEAAA